ncbi:calcineurin-like phosphoesterase family protein [Tumebacillus sp. BK434]|uniref:metallophosphoesterase family protein n=1 Tax=Tumebacillus sp. BK434 TaxID=2512169 RepID=UPI0010DD640A|nr:metallophosphoesterase [Tumebacillus sp. BK434]TCP53909.1 calcineurin-like phosphoesterase family protein [Tumebacillus sp. BK434]
MAPIYEKARKLLQSLPKSSAFRFVYFGDSWFDWGTTRADAVTRFQIFLGALETAARQTPKPLFILIGGDVVFSGTQQQFQYVTQKISQFMDTSKIPVFIAPGNHERTGPTGPLNLYRKYISAQLNYRIDVPRLRVVMLNDIGPSSALSSSDYASYYGFEQSGNALPFLKESLRTTPAGSKAVVVMHVPPRTGTWTRTNGTTFTLKQEDGFSLSKPKNRDFMNTLSANRNKMQKVLVGHVHTYATSTIHGIPYVLEGQGGAVIGSNSIVLFTVNNGIVSSPKRIPIKRSNKTPSKVFVGQSTLPNP